MKRASVQMESRVRMIQIAGVKMAANINAFITKYKTNAFVYGITLGPHATVFQSIQYGRKSPILPQVNQFRSQPNQFRQQSKQLQPESKQFRPLLKNWLRSQPSTDQQ